MRLAIMQPYFLPYIGYFQLMRAVDTFVFYDDVTFIKQGWINRNRILLNDTEFLFSLELRGASSFKNINTIEVGNNREKLFKTLFQSYKKAPFFKEVEPLLLLIFKSEVTNLSQYIIDANKLIASHLEIKTNFLISSKIDKNNELNGQDKVIEICRKLGYDKYTNVIGGKKLYSKDDFLNNGIELSFIRSNYIEYNQYNNIFIPWLSIIDVLMFNSVSEINLMLNNYELI